MCSCWLVRCSSSSSSRRGKVALLSRRLALLCLMFLGASSVCFLFFCLLLFSCVADTVPSENRAKLVACIYSVEVGLRCWRREFSMLLIHLRSGFISKCWK